MDESRACFLAFESAQCFVAGVLHLSGLGAFVIAAVYIPPHESKYFPGKYCDVLDSLSEAVQRLQLWYKVP